MTLSVVIAVGITACTSGGRAATTSTGAPATSRQPAATSSGPPGSEGSTGDSGAATSGDPVAVDDPATIPDSGALTAAAEGLPPDPAEAAAALVDRMFGDDPAQAVAATGELLRRAGLPLGSGAGPMVALPDKYVITNAQIGVELLPRLTEQARDGLAFDLDQVQALLTHLGIPQGELTDEELVGTLAEWGKGDGDPAESRTAGAAERALAHRHGQLLAPTDMPDAATLTALRDKPESLPLDEYQRLIGQPTAITLDPVQVVLLVAHMAGAVTDDPVVIQLPATADRTASSTPADETPHPLRRDAAAGPCSAIQAPLEDEVGKFDKGAVKAILQDQLKDAVERRFGETASGVLDAGFTGYDQLTDVLSYLAFTLALQFDMGPVGTKTTHFLHDESAHANDVTFEAHAYIVPVVPPEYNDCFALAGIDIPTDKELKDMQVIWTLPNGRVGLKPAVVGDRQFDVPILLDDHGKSTVQTTPRREKHPPRDGDQAPQDTVMQPVRAALDKNYLEIHASDIALMIFGDLPGAAVSVAIKVVTALIKEAGLPAKTVQFPVTYHGSNVYHIFGDATLSIPFYADVPLKADLYSCTGPEGPWQGSITVGGSVGPILKMAGHLVGYQGPDSGEDVVKAGFSVNAKVAQAQTFVVTDTYGVVVQLDQSAIDNGFQQKSGTGAVSERTKRIGWASWTIGGEDVRVLAGLIGGFMSQSLDLPVEAVDGDLRCKDNGVALYQNDFD